MAWMKEEDNAQKGENCDFWLGKRRGQLKEVKAHEQCMTRNKMRRCM